MPELRFSNCSKLTINPKNSNDATDSDITQSSDFAVFLFFVLFFFLKRSYWSKFHVNIITSSRVMAIFFYNGLTRNLEIENTPIRNLSYIWRLGQVGNTKFVTNVSNEMLLNAAKC